MSMDHAQPGPSHGGEGSSQGYLGELYSLIQRHVPESSAPSNPYPCPQWAPLEAANLSAEAVDSLLRSLAGDVMFRKYSVQHVMRALEAVLKRGSTVAWWLASLSDCATNAELCSGVMVVPSRFSCELSRGRGGLVCHVGSQGRSGGSQSEEDSLRYELTAPEKSGGYICSGGEICLVIVCLCVHLVDAYAQVQRFSAWWMSLLRFRDSPPGGCVCSGSEILRLVDASAQVQRFSAWWMHLLRFRDSLPGDSLLRCPPGGCVCSGSEILCLVVVSAQVQRFSAWGMRLLRYRDSLPGGCFCSGSEILVSGECICSGSEILRLVEASAQVQRFSPWSICLLRFRDSPPGGYVCSGGEILHRAELSAQVVCLGQLDFVM
ncbi:hypothetical protein PR048_000151 [Dryococelus australis]|uniref:Uncharacterized protein n=1 Tax=Dryococelus australis TaxID=614101 RepID=A0ABQ9IDU1_9NEOP|nr:hypothetical protein PR048_000151 [Dryococelus australis]